MFVSALEQIATNKIEVGIMLSCNAGILIARYNGNGFFRIMLFFWILHGSIGFTENIHLSLTHL